MGYMRRRQPLARAFWVLLLGLGCGSTHASNRGAETGPSEDASAKHDLVPIVDGVSPGDAGPTTNLVRLFRADFQTRAAGPYAQAMVAEDFLGKATWNNGLDAGRANIVVDGAEHFLRITYAGGVYGPSDGGVQFMVPFGRSCEEAVLEYRVRFAVGFTFVRGGKLPGLVGGTAPTGCVADSGGFSARMMWRSGGAAVQYLYYPGKVNSCGDDFPYLIGGNAVVFQPGTWHRVRHHLRMNTPGEHDGLLSATFDDAPALDKTDFIYRAAGMTFGIDALYFSTFFGGSDGTWAPSSAQSADFDDFVAWVPDGCTI
jgi:hypothetical protein